MGDELQTLADVDVFGQLDEGALALVADLTRVAHWPAGEVVYRAGDAPGGLYAVLQGAVEIEALIAGGEAQRTLQTVRAGGIFGWLSLIDRRERASTAIAVEETRALLFEPEAFERLRTASPATHDLIQGYFLRRMSRQVRDLLDLFRANVEWTLEISGLGALGLRDLVLEGTEVRVRLVDGESLEGRILRLEASHAGHELLLRTADGGLHLVPYHAIVRLSVGSAPTEISLPG